MPKYSKPRNVFLNGTQYYVEQGTNVIRRDGTPGDQVDITVDFGSDEHKRVIAECNRRDRANLNRRQRDDAYRSLGLVKCRDSQGRTIWE